MRSLVRVIPITIAAAAMLSSPRPASAQAAASAPLQAGFQDSFFIQTADGDTRLDFGMVAQTDGRFSLDDPPPFTDTFTIRKVRPTLTGKIAKYFTFKVDPDFGNGTVALEDAYLEQSGTRFVLTLPRTCEREYSDGGPRGDEPADTSRFGVVLTLDLVFPADQCVRFATRVHASGASRRRIGR